MLNAFLKKQDQINFPFFIQKSDLKIKLSNGTYLKAHKFVLDARSKNWNSQNLSIISELDLSGKFLRIYLIKNN